MLKEGAEELKEAFLHLYNTILQSSAPPPASWKNTVLTVIPKSGDLTLPLHYRPIRTLPLLYTLSSIRLNSRLQPVKTVG
eukprot:1026533-Pyramimonas_sp.AAC.2